MAEITTIEEYENCTNPLDIESINICQQKNFNNNTMDLNNIKKYKNLKKICSYYFFSITLSNIDIITQMLDDIDEIDCGFSLPTVEHINLIKYNNKNTIRYKIFSEINDNSILNHLPINLNTLIISNTTYGAWNDIFKAGLQNLPFNLEKIIFCQQLFPDSFILSNTHVKMNFLMKSKLPHSCKIYLSDDYFGKKVTRSYEVINNSGILTAVNIIQ